MLGDLLTELSRGLLRLAGVVIREACVPADGRVDVGDGPPLLVRTGLEGRAILLDEVRPQVQERGGLGLARVHVPSTRGAFDLAEGCASPSPLCALMALRMAESPAGPRPVLDAVSFTDHLAAEVARVRRSGGLLSLMLIDLKPGAADAPPVEGGLPHIAQLLRRTVRLQDSVALRGSNVALLLPDTSAIEATRAAERLLRLARGGPAASEPGSRGSGSAGVATVFGDVEGGGEALLAAAEEALQEAGPGEILRSRALEGRPRILVVDDDLSFAQVLAEAITERGWEGHPCTDVEDARQRVVDGGYSALFVDLMLPGTSGVEILRHAIAYHPRRPAVLMSGTDTDRGAILEALELGPVVFVRKPISSADLDSALRMFRELLPAARQERRA